MKTQQYLPLLFVLLMVFFFPALLHAQDPGTDPNTPAPIDGGVSLLIAAGVAYGIKKYRDSRKKSEKDKTEL